MSPIYAQNQFADVRHPRVAKAYSHGELVWQKYVVMPRRLQPGDPECCVIIESIDAINIDPEQVLLVFETRDKDCEFMISIDWGDGSPIDSYSNNTIGNAVHAYPSPGTYEVTVKVADECGTTEKKGEIILEPSACVPVTHVTKTSPFSVQANTDLPLTISILPPNATNQIHSWHIVDDGGTGATIENNVFRAMDAGTATVEIRIANALCDEVARTHRYSINGTWRCYKAASFLLGTRFKPYVSGYLQD